MNILVGVLEEALWRGSQSNPYTDGNTRFAPMVNTEGYPAFAHEALRRDTHLAQHPVSQEVNLLVAACVTTFGLDVRYIQVQVYQFLVEVCQAAPP